MTQTTTDYSGAFSKVEADIREAVESGYTTLSLDKRQLDVLPESLRHLHQLQQLNVSGNALTALPDWLGELSQLESLNLSNNKLERLPASLAKLKRMRRLDLFENQLRELPEWLGELVELRWLNARHNDLSMLPASIARLAELHSLHLDGNRLHRLPDAFHGLAELQSLTLSNNELSELPESMGELGWLWELDLSNNQIKQLPGTMRFGLSGLDRLFLHGNTELHLPPEILGPTAEEANKPGSVPAAPAAILDYYFISPQHKPLNEAKMVLVGRAGAGKTSLVNRLLHDRFDPDGRKTEGIAIDDWHVSVDNEDIRLNVWDFGGQEIMHATHQFFLTKRTLYLFVVNAREGDQDANIEYWLRLIESFGGDSPVIVVVNKTKDHLLMLNRRGLQTKFRAIREFVLTDCEANLGIEELRAAIVRETNGLEHLRDSFPPSWRSVKDQLTRLQRNYITYEEYQSLCVQEGISDATSQSNLVAFLHDLGTVVNFRDHPRLRNTHVLNPHWVTAGIYRILNAESLVKRGSGEVTKADVAQLLDETEYPQNKQEFLFDLMERFELCYKSYDDDNLYLVPELLTREEPELQAFATSDALLFEYRYNVLPEGLLCRFIVRSRVLNQGLPRWRTGVLLVFQGNRALVKADTQDRRISIAVVGDAVGQRQLLAVIRSDLEHIHHSIANLQAQEMVPLPGYPDVIVPYAKLQKLQLAGKSQLTEDVGNAVLDFDIGNLLRAIEQPPAAVPRSLAQPNGPAWRPVTIAISYSHKDEKLRDELETHLKLLQRQRVIETWHDRRVIAGQEWQDILDAQFKRADIILLLISADFLSSDYCDAVEVELAMERHQKQEAVVIPIILRQCHWRKAPLAALQGLPKDLRPVTVWADRDEAWTNIAEGIEKVALEVRNKRS